ncbi:Calmodulin [Ceratobasidium sp. 370]|nr:Calmodulin [Ceratobasidium sp. 370]
MSHQLVRPPSIMCYWILNQMAAVGAPSPKIAGTSQSQSIHWPYSETNVHLEQNSRRPFIFSTRVRISATSDSAHIDSPVDGDGNISAEELGSIMRSLGKSPSDAELQVFIEQGDRDHNGTIDLDEFLAMMGEKMQGVSTDDEMREAFRVFDKDGSGQISPEELKIMMSSLGRFVLVAVSPDTDIEHAGENLTDSEVQQMIEEADTDGDGQIDYDGMNQFSRARL